MNDSAPIIGEITYHDTGEFIPYTDPIKFLQDIKDVINSRGIWGWGYQVNKEYPELIKAVSDIIVDEFGD